MKTENQTIRPNTRKIEKVLAGIRKKYAIQNRLLNELDFYRICEAEDIMLITPEDTKNLDEHYQAIVKRLSKTKLDGFIAQVEGFNIIYLRSFFNRKIDMFFAAQALGHYFLKHSYGTFRLGWFTEDESAEKEADLFAELATGKRRARKTKKLESKRQSFLKAEAASKK